MSDFSNPRQGQRTDEQQARSDAVRDAYIQRLNEGTTPISRDTAGRRLLKPRNAAEHKLALHYAGQSEQAISDAIELHRNGGEAMVTPLQASTNRLHKLRKSYR
jgi:hypothetical protein